MPVEGTVTLDDRPLPKGEILFMPLPGTAGPTAGADIIDGRFVIAAADGPFAGTFRVQISQVGLTGRRVPNPRGSGMIDEYAQVLPARYNTDSQLKAEVKAHGPNHLEFALTSRR